MDERNRLILVRTLGMMSWLYAAFYALVGAMMVCAGKEGSGITAPRNFGGLMIVQALLLGAAGYALRGPRRGAWAATFLAAAGLLFFAALEIRLGSVYSALLDGLYAGVAAAIWLKAGHTS